MILFECGQFGLVTKRAFHTCDHSRTVAEMAVIREKLDIIP